MYVSVVEIFRKSVKAFRASDDYYEFSEVDAYMYATLRFFGGVVFMVVSDEKQLPVVLTNGIISARALLPTAHRYDPEDSVVTYSFILGMTVTLSFNEEHFA